MSRRVSLDISDEAWLELCNIGHGVFAPLAGFMDSKDYMSVVERMRLADGSPWTIPITLDVPDDRAQAVMWASELTLRNSRGQAVARMHVEDVFRVPKDRDLASIYGTKDPKHPGVAKERRRSMTRVGGAVQVQRFVEYLHPEYALTPHQARAAFKRLGWKTVTGFQTRNPIHRAHEYLQRVAMEITDGVFIHPLLGWKKDGDFTPKAIIEAYRVMVKQFYPRHRAVLSTLWTPMRYAGPREAVFHAIIRRNFGCTHFIVGRDHAGVGAYYDKYAAHELCRRMEGLGIEILALCGPYFCRRCDGIVTEKTCPHGARHRVDISGTELRAMLSGGRHPPREVIRTEICDALLNLARKDELFIQTGCHGNSQGGPR